MRILRIDRGGERLSQGLVRAEWPLRSNLLGGAANDWIRMFLRSASLWPQARPLSAAVRIAVEPGRPVTTVHSFVVERRDEERLRLVLAAFMRTDQMGAGHTEGPQTGEELEGRYLHPNEPRFAIVRESLRVANGLAVHHNFRLAERLPRLLQTFADLAVPFAYEMQAAPWNPPREQLREFLHNAARLDAAAGVPKPLAQDQISLGERVKRATFDVEECLSAPSAPFANAVGDTLTNLLDETFYSKFDAAPRMAALDPPRAQAFAHHVHSRVMSDRSAPTMADLTAAAVREDVDRCLSCLPLGFTATGTPPPDPEPLAFSLGPAGPGPAPAPGAGARAPPPPHDDGQRFLFVSYARADGGRVYPVVEKLAGAGVPLWIDKRIVGGDDWLVELETRLLKCSGVLAFVSASFVGSKYCGREIRFGDALNKKIIPVFLQPVELSGGLQFILHSIQRVMMVGDTDYLEIVSAIKAHLSVVDTAGR
jgi:hypothetical protein